MNVDPPDRTDLKVRWAAPVLKAKPASRVLKVLPAPQVGFARVSTSFNDRRMFHVRFLFYSIARQAKTERSAPPASPEPTAATEYPEFPENPVPFSFLFFWLFLAFFFSNIPIISRSISSRQEFQDGPDATARTARTALQDWPVPSVRAIRRVVRNERPS